MVSSTGGQVCVCAFNPAHNTRTSIQSITSITNARPLERCQSSNIPLIDHQGAASHQSEEQGSEAHSLHVHRAISEGTAENYALPETGGPKTSVSSVSAAQGSSKDDNEHTTRPTDEEIIAHENAIRYERLRVVGTLPASHTHLCTHTPPYNTPCNPPTIPPLF